MNGNTVAVRAGAAAMLLALAGTAHGQCGASLATLVMISPAANDQLGRAVSLSVTTGGGLSLMAGAPGRAYQGTAGAGAVLSFGRVNNVWGPLATIRANDPLLNAEFGASVDYDDPSMIVGAPGAGPGSIYIFERSGSTWTQKLKWTDGGANMTGSTVSIDHTAGIAVAGSPDADTVLGNTTYPDGGVVRVFMRNESGVWAGAGSYIFYGVPGAHQNGQRYGASVSMSGQRYLAGAPGYDPPHPQTQLPVTNAGKAFASRFDVGFQTWYQNAELVCPSPMPEDNFGATVALSGDFAAVAAPGREVGNATNAGAVFLYHDIGTPWEPNWVYEGMVQPVVPINNSGFGSTLEISGERLIVGSSVQHQVHVFRRTPEGVWALESRTLDPDGGDAFAESVSISGTDIAVGDPMEDPASVGNAGAAYVYQVTPNSADGCAGATPVTPGQTYSACTQNATVDGNSPCGGLSTSPDIWFKYTATQSGMLPLDTFGSSFDTVLSVHSGCPGVAANTVACNDDFSIFEQGSYIALQVTQGSTYYIRVAGKGTSRGPVTLHTGAFQAGGCYANCDNSTAAPNLNVADFTCFLQRFAAGEPYANCDNSTVMPTLNVADFTCFLQRFAAGCL